MPRRVCWPVKSSQVETRRGATFFAPLFVPLSLLLKTTVSLEYIERERERARERAEPWPPPTRSLPPPANHPPENTHQHQPSRIRACSERGPYLFPPVYLPAVLHSHITDARRKTRGEQLAACTSTSTSSTSKQGRAKQGKAQPPPPRRAPTTGEKASCALHRSPFSDCLLGSHCTVEVSVRSTRAHALPLLQASK
jgi:hypothetical protein